MTNHQIVRRGRAVLGRLRLVPPLILFLVCVGFVVANRDFSSAFVVRVRCSISQYKYQCYERALANIVKTESAGAALEMLAKLQVLDQDAAARCHEMGHHIGWAAYYKYRDIAGALREGTMLCGSSYIHGFLVQMLADKAAVERFNEVLPSICEVYKLDVDGGRRLHCVHGLGHGLMVMRNFDLFKALADCERLRTAWDHEFCAGGVFMENSTSEHLPKDVVPPYISLENPLYPCTIVPEKYKWACYHFTTGQVVMHKKKQSASEAFAICQRLEKTQERQFCYGGVGRIMIFDAKMKVDKALSWCATAPAEAQKGCFVVVADSFFEESGIENGSIACQKVPEEFRAACFMMLGARLAQYNAHGSGGWQALCRKWSGKYGGVCVAAGEQYKITLMHSDKI